MTKVFFAENTGILIFHGQWWCDACNKGTRVETGRGGKADFPAWPKPTPAPIPCEHCGQPAPFSSQGSQTIFKRSDTGELIDDLLKHPGACWNVDGGAFDRQSRTGRVGPDGRALAVMCPNGRSWHIDGRASNCTMPDDNEHRCWVRHGSPEDGTLHVDKNGHTCGAGAGSIVAGDYHGFLHNGEFRSC